MVESNRPLVCFDIETTGTDKSKDFIIQFAAIKVNQQTNEIIDTINTYIQPVGNYEMSLGAYMKHKIHPNFLKDKPVFIDVAVRIYDFIKECDLLTFNGINFDIPFLEREFHGCGIEYSILGINCYDACFEERRRNGNSLGKTFERYFGKTMDESSLNAHDALCDVKATWEIFKAQQEAMPYDPEQTLCDDNFVQLMEFSNALVPCFTVGKYKEISVEFVAKTDKQYIAWAVSNAASFSPSTKDFLQKYL